MKQDDEVSLCEECGASVYKEHIESGLARYADGRLLCSHCVVEVERSQDAMGGGMSDSFVPIELDTEDEGAEVEMSSTRIHTVGDGGLGKSAKADSDLKRPLNPNATGASRCRTFHCRISEGAVEFMNNQINEWLDEREDVTLKFAVSTIGLFEGKHTEPNIIMTVFY